MRNLMPKIHIHSNIPFSFQLIYFQILGNNGQCGCLKYPLRPRKTAKRTLKTQKRVRISTKRNVLAQKRMRISAKENF